MTEEVPPAHVGARLRSARVRRELSQRTAARRAGVAASYLSRIENGHIHPSFGTVHRIAQAISADMEEIVGPQPKGDRRGCPVTSHGRCLLDVIRDHPAATIVPHGEHYTSREIKLLRQLAKWMKTAQPDRLRAMEILIEEMGVSPPAAAER